MDGDNIVHLSGLLSGKVPGLDVLVIDPISCSGVRLQVIRIVPELACKLLITPFYRCSFRFLCSASCPPTLPIHFTGCESF